MNHRMKKMFKKKLSAKKVEKWMKNHTVQDLRDVVFEDYEEEKASKIVTLINELDALSCGVGIEDYNEETANFNAADKKIPLEA